MKTILILLISLLSLTSLLASPASAKEKFCVAVVQLASTDAGNFAKIDSFVKVAKRNGANLVVFPEESLFGWLNPIVFQKAAPIPGKYSDKFVDIALRNRIWISVGIAEEGPRIDSIYHEAYDSGILINPSGIIVLHHRQHNVVKNAFDQCPPSYGKNFCSYTPGPLSDIKVARTPFGRTAILVCADAYTYDKTVLNILKALKPQFVIINWGVTAAVVDSCGKQSYNATADADSAAKVLGSAYVVGANGRGNRPYGRFLPSCYCGTSGVANAAGQSVATTTVSEPIHYFFIPYPSEN
jgi:N-carbamoylputrescine amidase